MRTLTPSILSLLFACGSPSADTEPVVDSDSYTDSDADTDSDTDSDTDTDTDTDTDSDPNAVFATEAPGAGLFKWWSGPAATTNTCVMPGNQFGNGYVIRGVETSSRTFTLEPDSLAYPGATCTYQVSGSFTCGPEVTDYDLSTYGLSGLVTVSVSHTGKFEPVTLSLGEDEHTFAPSWALSIASHVVATCSADPTTCNYAAANGFGWKALPCETAYGGSTYNTDDPTYPG
jgi:hypothetical protein